MISYPHALMNSCSRALQSSCPLAIVPPSSRIGKNQVTRCYFVIWLLVSSSLTLSPALSSSQAKAYAPSVTRFPFLLVQVSKIVLPLRRNLHFSKIKGFHSRDIPKSPRRAPKTLPRAPQEAPRAVEEAPRGSQRRSKSTKRGLIVS